MEMSRVVIVRHRSTDGTFPAVTWPSTLGAHQRLRLCHRRSPLWISRPKAVGGTMEANPPPAPVQLLRAWRMPRMDTSAPTTKITVAR